MSKPLEDCVRCLNSNKHLFREVAEKHKLVMEKQLVNHAEDLFQVQLDGRVFNLGDHMYSFVNDQNVAVLITHPYVSELPTGEELLDIKDWAGSRGMEVVEYNTSLSFYNPGETAMFVFTITDKKMFRKSVQSAWKVLSNPRKFIRR